MWIYICSRGKLRARNSSNLRFCHMILMAIGFILFNLGWKVNHAYVNLQGSLGNNDLCLWHKTTRDPIFSLPCCEGEANQAKSISFADHENPCYIHVTTSRQVMMCDLRMHKSFLSVLGIPQQQFESIESCSLQDSQTCITSTAARTIPSSEHSKYRNGHENKQGLLLGPAQANHAQSPFFLVRRRDTMTVYDVATSKQLYDVCCGSLLETHCTHSQKRTSVASGSVPPLKFSSQAVAALDGRVVLSGTNLGELQLFWTGAHTIRCAKDSGCSQFGPYASVQLSSGAISAVTANRAMSTIAAVDTLSRVFVISARQFASPNGDICSEF
eukprot:m.526591 g.526591  ORF g.526591 m.526591 type:complete len:328 (+) comp22003_c0_seq5:69-1052(+)